MTDDGEFQTEPIIGHHVAATERPTSDLDDYLDVKADELGIERMFDSRRIEIEVGDVDWDDTKTVTLRLETLRAIVDHFDDEGGDE